jgi:hypothetical protein
MKLWQRRRGRGCRQIRAVWLGQTAEFGEAAPQAAHDARDPAFGIGERGAERTGAARECALPEGVAQSGAGDGAAGEAASFNAKRYASGGEAEAFDRARDEQQARASRVLRQQTPAASGATAPSTCATNHATVSASQRLSRWRRCSFRGEGRAAVICTHHTRAMGGLDCI